MAWEFVIHAGKELIYKKVWRSYGTEDSVNAHKYWDDLCDRESVSNFNELQDLSEVTEYGVSIEQIHSLVGHYQYRTTAEKQRGAFIPKRIAYVIPSKLAYGTGRVYAALIEDTGLNFRVFDDMTKACDWLELTLEDRSEVLLTKNGGQ